MKLIRRLTKVVPLAFLLATASLAQSPVSTVTLTSDQIGQVRTAQGITTRIAFPEEVAEIICGDLYDPVSGRGSFVAQSSGTDVFIKPIPAKGMSNLFVKTKGKRVYNFNLSIVPTAQAHYVVNVTEGVAAPPQAENSAPSTQAANGSTTPTQNVTQPQNGTQLVADPGKPASEAEKSPDTRDLEQRRAEALQQAQQQADELLRNARQQAGRIVEEAEAKLADVDRQSAQRGEQEAERRFVQSLMLGIREAKVSNTRVATKKMIVQLEPRVLTFGDKSYLRYTIQNTGDKPFTFSAVSLEVGDGKEMRPVTIELIQSKAENSLEPGESLTGVIAFDGKTVTAKDKLVLYLRGEDSSEIARIGVQ